MTKAGFKLPKTFRFEPEEDGVLGSYNSYTDTVSINSNVEEFRNLEDQNRLEESQRNFHPVSKHFLHSYIHEFSHAAHFNNIRSKLGSTNAYHIFSGFLDEHSPEECLVGPLTHDIKSAAPSMASKVIEKIFPHENGLYAKTNLKEYFAEKNSRLIAEQLGKNYILSGVKPNTASSYQSTPEDWNFAEKFRDRIRECICTNCEKEFNLFGFVFDIAEDLTKILKLFDERISYIDGDIFNGNIDGLENVSLISKNW